MSTPEVYLTLRFEGIPEAAEATLEAERVMPGWSAGINRFYVDHHDKEIRNGVGTIVGVTSGPTQSDVTFKMRKRVHDASV